MRDDLEAILLVECPACLRVAVLILAILVAHILGLAWTFAAAYEREAVRAEVQGELTELRNQVRHLWAGHEALRTLLNRAELAQERPREPRPTVGQGVGMGGAERRAQKPL